MAAVSEFVADLTVNEAEYRGLLLCFDLLADQTRGRMIICGDSNLVIRQMRGEIDCKASGLQLLRHKAMEKLRSWPKHEFLHVKRDWNASADRLASEALQKEKVGIVMNDQERQDLITLNRLDELLLPRTMDKRVRVAAITRADSRRRRSPQILQEEIVQQMRIERVKQEQDIESRISNLKIYLSEDISTITSAEAKSCALMASDFEVDQDEFFFPDQLQSQKIAWIHCTSGQTLLGNASGRVKGDCQKTSDSAKTSGLTRNWLLTNV